MSSTPPLDIKVIYSAGASLRPRGMRRVVKVTRPISTKTQSLVREPASAVVRVMAKPRRRWLILGVLNILIAGGLYYGTWWPADKFIYWTFMWKTPVPGMDAEQFMAQLFPGNAPASTPKGSDVAAGDNSVRSSGTDDQSEAELSDSGTTQPRFTGKTATTIIGATAIGWLTISTISLCALALAGGNAIVRIGGTRVRRIGMILTVGSALCLIWLTYGVLSRHKMGYSPDDLRIGMGALTFWFGLLGLAINRAHVGLLRFAAVALIVAGACTAVAVYLAHQCGVIEQTWAGPIALLLAFVAHSLYGWVLLPVSARLNRPQV